MSSDVEQVQTGLWGERRAQVVGRATCLIPSLSEAVVLRDLSLSGFVLELPVPLSVGSVHPCDFNVDGRVVRTSARVTERRYRPAAGTHTVRFKFRSLSSRDDATIRGLAGGVLGFSGT